MKKVVIFAFAAASMLVSCGGNGVKEEAQAEVNTQAV